MNIIRKYSYRGALRGLIFDWAGTTVDYGCFGPVAVFIEVFKRRQIIISEADARMPMGLEKRDHIRAIAQQPHIADQWQKIHGRECGEGDIDRMYQESVHIQADCIANFADPIPGTVETMAICRDRGLKIGSSTGYSRDIMNILAPKAASLGYAPDCIVCPSDVPKGRPAPWMIYQNAMQLDVYPMPALVKIGDTLPDIAEGQNAGVWIVCVTQTGNELGLSHDEVLTLDPHDLAQRLALIEAKFREAGAHFVIPSVADLPPILDDIETLLRAGEHP